MSNFHLSASSAETATDEECIHLLNKGAATACVEPIASGVQLSVCIANWNCKEYLRACLNSLREAAEDLPLEVIVYDNASTDGAPDMVERDFPEVVLIRSGVNRGFSHANNRAAARSQGRFLLFLNNDTVVTGAALFQLIEYAERNPDIGIIGPRLRDARGRVQVSYRLAPTMSALLHRTMFLRWTGLFKGAYRRYRRQDFDSASVRRVDVLMGAAVLMARELFQRVGGWDESFMFGGEDIDLSMRVGRQARVVYFPQAEILHYGRVSSRQHAGFTSSQFTIGLLRYLRKSGYGRFALLGFKFITTIDAPLQLYEKLVRGTWRQILGRREKAQRCWLAARGHWHFLTRGLLEYWRT